MRQGRNLMFGGLLATFSGACAACVFSTAYNLPIPFQMYASGAATALIASFAIVGYVLNVRPAGDSALAAVGDAGEAPRIVLSPGLVRGLAGASVCGLLLTIATALFGSRSPFANFGVTFFWMVFALGFAYWVAFFGDAYALINPWRTLCEWFERRAPGAFRGRIAWPPWLGCYPALALYMAFIWLELFGATAPRVLAEFLAAYTALNLAGAWVFGKDAWFERGEFFSLLFRLIGKMAPVRYVARAPAAGGGYEAVLRKPFVGLLDEPADHVSVLIFVLFMLSSTAYDGAHVTLPWVSVFWKGLYPTLAALVSVPYARFVQVYYAWQWSMLLLSPLIYLIAYLALLWLAKFLARSDLSLKSLALRFAYTLVPIAFVYNVTHYYGELVVQGVQIVRMASDPFGLGWNLFGTAHWLTKPIVLDAGGVWHTQVALILLGHIVAVYLAHVEALKVFAQRRLALISQLPMLALMVLLTTLGLWILSLPIEGGQVMMPGG